MTNGFKKFKMQSEIILETRQCCPYQVCLSPSLTSCRSLWLIPNLPVLATAYVSGSSPGPVPGAALPIVAVASSSAKPWAPQAILPPIALLICWYPSADNAPFPANFCLELSQTPFSVLGAAHKGQCLLEGREGSIYMSVCSLGRKSRGKQRTIRF